MKQIICEMCGSTDIVKQDGLFVCQSCGIKYSVEEARKLMVEVSGKVDVSGSTVKIDQSQKLKNLISAARISTSSKNYESAAQQWEEIQRLDPKNWEACYYSTYCRSLIVRIGHLTPTDDYPAIISSIKQALILLKNNGANESTINSAINTIMSSLDLVIEPGIQNAQRRDREEQDYRNQFGFYMDPNYSMDGYWRYQKVEAGKLYCAFGEAINKYLKKNDSYQKKAINALTKGIRNIDNSRAVTDNDYTRYKNLLDQLQVEKVKRDQQLAAERKRKKQEEAKAKSDAFWKEHPEEKQKLLDEINSLSAQITEATAKYDRLIQPILNIIQSKEKEKEKEINYIQEEIKELLDKKSSLGMFEFKKNKELTAEIEELTGRQRYVQSVFDIEKNEASLKLENLKEKKEKEIGSLKKRQQKLENKLKIGQI